MCSLFPVLLICNKIHVFNFYYLCNADDQSTNELVCLIPLTVLTVFESFRAVVEIFALDDFS